MRSNAHYEITVERKNRLDVMTITVELIDDRLPGQLRTVERTGEPDQDKIKVPAWTRNADPAGCTELSAAV